MVELVPSDQAGQFVVGFAGDTFNTAWYLAQTAHDIEVSYLTAVGTDQISQDMRAFITGSGIDDTYIRNVPDATVGLYMISLNGGERSFSYWRGQSAARRLAEDEATLIKAITASDLVYVSGITLAILGADDRERLKTALCAGRAHGKRVAFDPNLRPALWPSVQEMCTTIMDVAALSDIVLPSFEDEAQWFGDASPADTLDRYAHVGSAQIVVKNGGKDILYRDHKTHGVFEVKPVPHLVDTTAAGDSFNAGLLIGLLQDSDLMSGLRYGSYLARQVIQHKGALVSVDPPSGSMK